MPIFLTGFLAPNTNLDKKILFDAYMSFEKKNYNENW